MRPKPGAETRNDLGKMEGIKLGTGTTISTISIIISIADIIAITAINHIAVHCPLHGEHLREETEGEPSGFDLDIANLP